MAEAEKQKQAEEARKAAFNALIASADIAFDAGKYSTAKDDYKKALTYEPNNAYAKQRIARIDEINRALAKTTGSSGITASANTPKIVAAIPMGELNFKTESERQKYSMTLKINTRMVLLLKSTRRNTRKPCVI